MRTVAMKIADANEYIELRHRHHKKVQGHKFSIGALRSGEIVGVCIVGRPVSRHLDDGTRVEIRRLCSDGSRNVCSYLYGAAARAAWALGYDYICTYTLASEPGTSLVASGFSMVKKVRGQSWNRKKRPRVDKHPTVAKIFWQLERPK